ncbi:MAG: glucose 1-dehydrogenase [Deltaproteobacteria bacterium]|nr:glucose 1-dehydrogenase [Deltaproteobacteria bacterium]
MSDSPTRGAPAATPTELFDLGGKAALVTGGSRGLGREMALAFAQLGADVMIASRKQDSCDQTAEEIRRATGRRVIGRACHVGRWKDLDALADAAYAEFGAVDVLVNNAGMSPVYPSVDAVGEELWDKVLDVNLKGPFRLTALVGTRMAQGRGGSIINVSSGAAARPTPDVIPYAAAKAGLEAMTIGFAHAFGPRVRVNAIQAGPFFTDISKAWDMEAFQRLARERLALRRGGEPSEIVGAAVYLASRAASFTTGAVLRVDGGSA